MACPYLPPPPRCGCLARHTVKDAQGTEGQKETSHHPTSTDARESLEIPVGEPAGSIAAAHAGSNAVSSS